MLDYLGKQCRSRHFLGSHTQALGLVGPRSVMSVSLLGDNYVLRIHLHFIPVLVSVHI